MNRFTVGFALLLATPLLVRAQSPEFALQLNYSENSPFQQTLSFGYDSRATFGKDAIFGEQDFPNFGGPPGAGSIFFTYDDSVLAQQGTATRIDILPKPQGPAVIQYLFHLNGGTYPAHLVWDRTKIPSAITAIHVAPLSASTIVMVDMKQQSSIDINTTDISDVAHYYSNWQNTVITIYYNMPPPNQGGIDYADRTVGLIGSLTAYPNPLTARGSLSLTANESANVTLTAYDVTGRELLRETRAVPKGVNEIDLSGLNATAGAVMLHIEATSGTRHEVRNVMVVKD